MNLFEDFNRLQRQIDKIEDEAVRQIAREYADGLEDLRNVVRDKYDQYADGDELTYSKMAKYDRIKKLNKEVAATARDMHVKASKITRSVLRDTYRTSFSNVQDAVSEAVSQTIRGQIKRETIQQALQNPISGLTLNDRLRVRRRGIITDIQETIGQGLYNGESYSSMSNRLKDTLEGDVNKAHRIVRTETHRVMEKSKLDSLDHAVNQGVDIRKYWVDSSDERVRDGHAHMAEKYDEENAIPYEEDFVNDKTGGEGPSPGLLGVAEDDIHCRCFMSVIIV